MRNYLLFTGLVLFIFFPITSSHAEIWDIKSDWSDTANGGTWSYRHGEINLTHIDQWVWPSQPAWHGGAHVPVWFRSTNDNPDGCDFKTGDIITHSTDTSNGAGMGSSNAIWASPMDCTVDISGNIWAARDIGRSNHWDILLNNISLSDGDVYSGDSYSRSNPFDFSQGSGGSSILQDISVSQGDILELRVTTNIAHSGDFVGINFIISSDDCQEDADCADDLFCNGAETCVSGVCVDGPGDPCVAGETCNETIDSCDAAPDCTVDDDCTDNLFCNGVETCVAGACVDGPGNPCEAGETCNETLDTCDAAPECTVDADCDDTLFCTGAETCAAGDCVAGPGNPCEAGETCDEGIDECICDVEWDLDGDCDVDKDDANILKLRQKAEKTALSNRHKAEKAAMKAAMGSLVDCGMGWDLDNDCDVDRQDSKLLKLRQKAEKTALKEKHTAEKAAMKAAL